MTWKTNLPDPASLADATPLHLWHLSQANEGANWLSLLAPDELDRMQTIVDGSVKHRYLTYRVALRRILGHYLRQAPESISLTYSALGKPLLESPEIDLHFNLTHAGEHALLAVSLGQPVGIDLEVTRPRTNLERIARRIFTAEVAARVESLTGSEKIQYFQQQWTRSEAIAKAFGLGVFSWQQADLSHLQICSWQPFPDSHATLARLNNLPDLSTWGFYSAENLLY